MLEQLRQTKDINLLVKFYKNNGIHVACGAPTEQRHKRSDRQDITLLAELGQNKDINVPTDKT